MDYEAEILKKYEDAKGIPGPGSAQFQEEWARRNDETYARNVKLNLGGTYGIDEIQTGEPGGEAGKGQGEEVNIHNDYPEDENRVENYLPTQEPKADFTDSGLRTLKFFETQGEPISPSAREEQSTSMMQWMSDFYERQVLGEYLDPSTNPTTLNMITAVGILQGERALQLTDVLTPFSARSTQDQENQQRRLEWANVVMARAGKETDLYDRFIAAVGGGIVGAAANPFNTLLTISMLTSAAGVVRAPAAASAAWAINQLKAMAPGLAKNAAVAPTPTIVGLLGYGLIGTATSNAIFKPLVAKRQLARGKPQTPEEATAINENYGAEFWVSFLEAGIPGALNSIPIGLLGLAFNATKSGQSFDTMFVAAVKRSHGHAPQTGDVSRGAVGLTISEPLVKKGTGRAASRIYKDVPVEDFTVEAPAEPVVEAAPAATAVEPAQVTAPVEPGAGAATPTTQPEPAAATAQTAEPAPTPEPTVEEVQLGEISALSADLQTLSPGLSQRIGRIVSSGATNKEKVASAVYAFANPNDPVLSPIDMIGLVESGKFKAIAGLVKRAIVGQLVAGDVTAMQYTSDEILDRILEVMGSDYAAVYDIPQPIITHTTAAVGVIRTAIKAIAKGYSVYHPEIDPGAEASLAAIIDRVEGIMDQVSAKDRARLDDSLLLLRKLQRKYDTIKTNILPTNEDVVNPISTLKTSAAIIRSIDRNIQRLNKLLTAYLPDPVQIYVKAKLPLLEKISELSGNIIERLNNITYYDPLQLELPESAQVYLSKLSELKESVDEAIRYRKALRRTQAAKNKELTSDEQLRNTLVDHVKSSVVSQIDLRVLDGFYKVMTNPTTGAPHYALPSPAHPISSEEMLGDIYHDALVGVFHDIISGKITPKNRGTTGVHAAIQWLAQHYTELAYRRTSIANGFVNDLYLGISREESQALFKHTFNFQLNREVHDLVVNGTPISLDLDGLPNKTKRELTLAIRAATTLANNYLKVNKQIIKKLRDLGIAIWEREGYIRQGHDASKMRTTGGKDLDACKNAWVSYIYKRLDLSDFDKIFGVETLGQLNPENIRKSVLADIYNNITEEGDSIITLKRRGSSAQAHKRRMLKFKDSTSLMEYNEAYGADRSVLQLMQDHVSQSAQDIAVYELFGPKAGKVANTLDRDCNTLLEKYREGLTYDDKIKLAGISNQNKYLFGDAGYKIWPSWLSRIVETTNAIAVADYLKNVARYALIFEPAQMSYFAKALGINPGRGLHTQALVNIVEAVKGALKLLPGASKTPTPTKDNALIGLPKPLQEDMAFLGLLHSSSVRGVDRLDKSKRAALNPKIAAFTNWIGDRVGTNAMLRVSQNNMGLLAQRELAKVLGRPWDKIDPKLRRVFMDRGLTKTDYERIEEEDGVINVYTTPEISADNLKTVLFSPKKALRKVTEELAKANSPSEILNLERKYQAYTRLDYVLNYLVMSGVMQSDPIISAITQGWIPKPTGVTQLAFYPAYTAIRSAYIFMGYSGHLSARLAQDGLYFKELTKWMRNMYVYSAMTMLISNLAAGKIPDVTAPDFYFRSLIMTGGFNSIGAISTEILSNSSMDIMNTVAAVAGQKVLPVGPAYVGNKAVKAGMAAKALLDEDTAKAMYYARRALPFINWMPTDIIANRLFIDNVFGKIDRVAAYEEFLLEVEAAAKGGSEYYLRPGALTDIAKAPEEMYNAGLYTGKIKAKREREFLKAKLDQGKPPKEKK